MLRFMGLQRVGHDSATELPEFYIAQMEFEFFYPLSGRIPSSNVSNTRIWRVRKFLVSYHAAAAAAKSLSHVRLCDPIDSSPPGSPVPGILQARALEWVAICFSNAGK